MSLKRLWRVVLAVVVVVEACPIVLAAPRYFSGPYTWDNNVSADWATASGGPYTSKWLSGSDAVFEGSPGAVNVSGTIVSVGSIAFSVDGYTLGGTGAINLTGTGGFVTTGAGTDTIGATITGSVGLTKAGAGTLVLSGSNTYTGTTTVNAGTLRLSNAISPTINGSYTLAGGTLLYDMTGSTESFAVYPTASLTADSTVGTANGQVNFGGTLNGHDHVLRIDNGSNDKAFYFGGTVDGVREFQILAGAMGTDGKPLGITNLPPIRVSNGAGFWTFNDAVIRNWVILNGGAGPGGLGALRNQGDGLTAFSGWFTLAAGDSSIGTDGGDIVISADIDGPGGITKIGPGKLTLTGNNVYSGGTTVSQGVLQVNAVSLKGPIVNNANVTFEQTVPGTYAGSMSGTGSLTKTGSETLILTGANSYGGDTTVSSGTLQIDSPLPAAAGRVRVESLGTLVANASVPRPILGAASGSSIVANTADVTLGDASSYMGFSHAGILTIGSNTVTLNSKGFANLGVLTTLGGGTLLAHNGISIGVGCNLSGAGVVNGKVAAGFGATIDATGNLSLGDPATSAGFASDGELHVNTNQVTLNDSNQAVLGSLTEVGSGGASGTLNAPNGVVVEVGKNLVGQGTVNSINSLAKATIVNGAVEGTGTGLNLTGYVKGVGTYAGTVSFGGTYSPGLSPAAVYLENMSLTSDSTLLIEMAGATPGSEYDVVSLSGVGRLAGTLDVDLLGAFVPKMGDKFDVLNGTMTGTFDNLALPSLGSGLLWDTSELYSNGTLTVIPEPSAFLLLLAGAAGCAALARWRTRERQRQD